MILNVPGPFGALDTAVKRPKRVAVSVSSGYQSCGRGSTAGEKAVLSYWELLTLLARCKSFVTEGHELFGDSECLYM